MKVNHLYGAWGLKIELSVAHVVACTRIIKVWLSLNDCSRQNDDRLSKGMGTGRDHQIKGKENGSCPLAT